jgi:hypothetical protein
MGIVTSFFNLFQGKPQSKPAPRPDIGVPPGPVYDQSNGEAFWFTNPSSAVERNFNALQSAAGPVAAFDYLLKHCAGGAELYRQAFRGSREESARVVNRYCVGANTGFVDGREYVLGGNPFTRTGGIRFKLPG